MMMSGFDAEDISENAPVNMESLDASATHIANLLSSEPSDGMCLMEFIVRSKIEWGHDKLFLYKGACPFLLIYSLSLAEKWEIP